MKVERISRYAAIIGQDRDQFTDMMSDGTYYDAWPDESSDPNCQSRQFDDLEGATEWARRELKVIEERNVDADVSYRAWIIAIGPRGKETVIVGDVDRSSKL